MEVWQETLQKLISLPKIDESSIQISNDIDIVSIVESLQPYMTHSDPIIRGKAVTVFKVAVYQKFESINVEGLSLLKSFVTQKVEDAAVVIEALTVLNFFYQRKVFNETEMLSICIRALSCIKSFRFGVENRNGIFKFVLNFMKSVENISGKDSEIFYETFLNSIESEKDPRNLMLVFDMIHCMSKFEFSNDDYVEEIFESIFCYFPITFRSNPSDPNLITVEELKGSLRRAIAGDKRFGDLSISLLIDKISSSNTSAKIDSLDVLLDSVNVYDSSAFIQYLYQLEVVIFSEIISNPDMKIQSKALKFVNLLSNRLSNDEEGTNWMNKFLMEAIKAIELESQEIISKSAILIESISSSNEISFKYTLDTCAIPLIKYSSSGTSESIKGQVARNCLVAMFSPLKNNPQWIHSINPEIVGYLNNLFSSIDCYFEGYGVYLVIFSFISSSLDANVSDYFIKKFISTSTNSSSIRPSSCDGTNSSVCTTSSDTSMCTSSYNTTCNITRNSSRNTTSNNSLISNELKNCIWLASKSYPSGFSNIICQLENEEIISASASTGELTKLALIRLIELNRISSIEQVLLKCNDFSKVTIDKKLILNLLNLPINSNSIIKIFSNCDKEVQIEFIKNKKNKSEKEKEKEKETMNMSNISNTSNTSNLSNIFEILLIAARPDVILNCKQEIIEEISNFKNSNTIISLFNKCPNTFELNYFDQPELFLSAIKGLIYRMEPKALILLKENVEKFPFPLIFYSKMFKIDEKFSFSLTETFHIKKSLHMQWILNFLLQQHQQSQIYLIVLISVISISPISLINLNSKILSNLILNFLKNEEIFKEIDFEILESTWKILLEHFESDQIFEVIHLALNHSSIEKETHCVIRYFALKILSKIIENPLTRSKLIIENHSNIQNIVLSTLKSGPLNDPKRIVRQEAARANNLWIIYKEDGVL